jgi:glycerophosphoryl diester phosphodiesterase
MWTWPHLIAHRGGGSIAPENTIAGLKAALQHGYCAVEFDVMLAADGVPVLMHDESLGRTVAGAGPVSLHTSAALTGMDAGAWLHPRFAGEPVPLYRTALDFCIQHGLWMNVEIKPATGMERETGTAVARLTRDWLGETARGQVLFSSFSPVALEAARAAAPAIARGWLLNALPVHWPQDLHRLQASSLHLDHRLLDAELAAQVLALGYGLFCYTVNAPSELRRLSALGVDAICTDRIDLFAADAFPVLLA